MNKEIAQALCSKWIDREREIRLPLLKDYPKIPDNFVTEQRRADILRQCRRELQEAAGLVMTKAEVAELLVINRIHESTLAEDKGGPLIPLDQILDQPEP